MGKSLKGKELGIGISQRKDGLYTGRYTDKYGKRRQKYFAKLQDCRRWMADVQFQQEHGSPEVLGEMSVDAWFDYWINEIKGDNIRISTRRNYEDRYNQNIRKVIGDMSLSQVKPLHCQHVLNLMINDYKRSTIGLTRTAMYCIFEAAVENELIAKNPVTRAVKCVAGGESYPKEALTLEEQRLFLESAQQSRYYAQYVFVLQTGLRCGEVNGLRWEDVDLDKKIIHVRQALYNDSKRKGWVVGTPKSKAGKRDIPLTKEAIDILRAQQKKTGERKTVPIRFANLVFFGNDGSPTRTDVYDSDIKRACDRAGIRRISMHILRHTFATRCIEFGMRPKTLQIILGHSNITMTMDLYVHVTEDEKVREMEAVEEKILRAQ